MHAASFHTCKVARALAAEKGELRSKTITNDGARLEMSDTRASDLSPDFVARQPGHSRCTPAGSVPALRLKGCEVRKCTPPGAVNPTAPAHTICGGSLDTASPLAKRGSWRERAAIEAPDRRVTHLQDL